MAYSGASGWHSGGGKSAGSTAKGRRKASGKKRMTKKEMDDVFSFMEARAPKPVKR